MINILLIGAGQLGSRHLQALALLRVKANIYVIDPSAESLVIAQDRFDQVNENFIGNIEFDTTLDAVPRFVDFLIIATSSRIRRTIIETVVSKTKVKYLILEKVLFTKPNDYLDVSNILKEHGITAWVNCPRRMNSYYKSMSSKLEGRISFNVTGNGWGIGCNSIHLIDLFALLSQTSHINVDTSGLLPQIFDSKRDGYIEFGGTLTASTDKGDTFTATCYTSGTSSLSIFIHSENARYIIIEGPTSKVLKSEGSNNWSWEEEYFKIDYQSNLTNKCIEQILEKGTCELTSYEESSTLHLALLNALIPFQNKLLLKDNDECLIT